MLLFLERGAWFAFSIIIKEKAPRNIEAPFRISVFKLLTSNYCFLTLALLRLRLSPRVVLLVVDILRGPVLLFVDLLFFRTS